MTDDVKDLGIPFGLRWAHGLAAASLTGQETMREAFTRRLFVGMAGATAAAFTVGALVQYFITHAPALPLLLGAVVSTACLVAVIAASGRGFFIFVSSWLLVCTAISAWAAIHTGGVSGVVNMVWTLLGSMLATLLIGRRSGLIWLGVGGVCFVSFASWPQLVGPFPRALDTRADLVGALGTLFMFGCVALLCLTWFVQQRDIAEALVEAERQRADDVLFNVMPAAVATRLKRGELVADHLENVSVLFADLVGFTALAASMSAPRLVQVLDDLFRELDTVVNRAGVEKIKTIGDCYMVASGAPEPRADHAAALVRVALEMANVVASRDFAGHKLQLRIGVHTGPVVAGVIGSKRQAYDLWGDTVNIASRLESSGVPGQVQVSGATKARLDHRFDVATRGLVDLKGKGGTETFIVRSWDDARRETA